MKTAPIRPLALLPLLALALAACHGEAQPTTWGTPPDQLEALTVTGLTTGAEVTESGAVTVTGSDQDFTVTVGTAAPLTIHTPGKSDLSILGGRTLTVDFPVSEAFGPTTRTMLVTDAQGPVYVANLGYGIDTDTLFGAGFVTYGAPVASVVDQEPAGAGYIETDYGPLSFKGDTGAVSLLPGQVGAVTVKGVVYRVTVIGATDVTYHDNGQLACGPSSTMVYEMLRVATPPTPLQLVRPASLGPISLGCLGV